MLVLNAINLAGPRQTSLNTCPATRRYCQDDSLAALTFVLWSFPVSCGVKHCLLQAVRSPLPPLWIWTLTSPACISAGWACSAPSALQKQMILVSRSQIKSPLFAILTSSKTSAGQRMARGYSYTMRKNCLLLACAIWFHDLPWFTLWQRVQNRGHLLS